MPDLMSADHLHDHFLHFRVQKNMPFLMAVCIHSQKIVQVVKVMHIDTKLTGNLQSVPCSAAFHDALRLVIDFLGANNHGTLTPSVLQVSNIILSKHKYNKTDRRIKSLLHRCLFCTSWGCTSRHCGLWTPSKYPAMPS